MDGDFESFKEQVRSAADMVQVISSYVPLKKKGQNYWGCCPFHGEKTPSFAVNPAKSMFYCFGCHEGGDIFKFPYLKNRRQRLRLHAKSKKTASIMLTIWRQNSFRPVLLRLLMARRHWPIWQVVALVTMSLPALA